MAAIHLLPSILTADFGSLAASIAEAEAAGVDGFHLDVMDGLFVPNITFGVSTIEAVRQATALPLDVHLMVEEPLRLLPTFLSTGVEMVTVHVEACRDPYRVVDDIRHAECLAGIALNPGTPPEAVRELLPYVDRVLVMTVPPGFGGAPFIAGSPARIRRLGSLIAAAGLESPPPIQVDGGVDGSTIRAVVDAGARYVVAGSSIYNNQQSVPDSVRVLREALA